MSLRYYNKHFHLLVYQSPGTLVPIPCSNGSGPIGNALPSIFLDDFINAASVASNAVSYGAASLQTHTSDDSTATSWYLNLPPPPHPPPLSLMTSPNVTASNMPKLHTNSNASSAKLISFPTKPNISSPLCTIKNPKSVLSKDEAVCRNETKTVSSYKTGMKRNLLK